MTDNRCNSDRINDLDYLPDCLCIKVEATTKIFVITGPKSFFLTDFILNQFNHSRVKTVIQERERAPA